MKKLLFIVGVLVFVSVALILVSKFLLKGSLEEKISKITGLPTKIDSFETGYFIKIKGLKIKNPQGFSNDTMIDIASLNIDKNLGEMEVRVKNLLVEKSPTGRLNIDYLSPDREQWEDFQLKKLKMHIDKVSYRDEAKKQSKEYDVDIHRQYGNLSNPGSVIDIIVSEGVGDTNLPKDEDITPPGDTDVPPGEDIPPGDGDNGGDGGQPPKPPWGGGWYQ
ncbi:MAG: hypothetical protein AB1629_04315 [Candidatus Omnitrophota bacterium]